ncbi:MAG: asparaginase [Alphaproteobacteria bacterium]
MNAEDRSRQVNPVLVRGWRGEWIESVHRGAFAVADASGRNVASLGDIGRKVFPRSAIKLIQALPLVESGAAVAVGLGDVELALACASHGGEPAHVSAVEAWLKRIGCSEADLDCGAHAPSYAPAAEALVREGKTARRVHNNCSGKHTGFLTLAKHLGAPSLGYDEPSHPVQQRVVQVLSELSGVAPSEFEIGIDGCGAPNFALPLGALATAFARVADPSALAPARREAILRLRGAVKAQPFYIAGTGRLCTRIIESGADVIPKTGAEGVYVASLSSLRLGVALKIDDGASLAAQCLVIALLAALGAIAKDAPLARAFLDQPITNTQGKVVGARRPDFETIAACFGKQG